MEKFKPHPKFWLMLALLITGFSANFLAGVIFKQNPETAKYILWGGLLFFGAVCYMVVLFISINENFKR